MAPCWGAEDVGTWISGTQGRASASALASGAAPGLRVDRRVIPHWSPALCGDAAPSLGTGGSSRVPSAGSAPSRLAAGAQGVSLVAPVSSGVSE